MARIVELLKQNSTLLEADLDLSGLDGEEGTEEATEEPVEGTEEETNDAVPEDAEPQSEEEPEEESDDASEEESDETEEESEEEPEEDDNKMHSEEDIEKAVGIVEITQTSSSTIIDYEDGGQTMLIQPIVALKTETIRTIIDMIANDVLDTYAATKDEITGMNLASTKYWISIETLIDAMVRSQLTKSENLDGLFTEVKTAFKVLEIK